MKKITKLIAAIAAAATMTFSIAGCGLVVDIEEVESIEAGRKAQAEAEAQMAEVVMTVDGEEVNGAYYGFYFANAYNTAYSAASQAAEAEAQADSAAASSAEAAPSVEVDMEAVKADAQEQIVATKAAYKKAKDAGIELTDEDLDAIDEQIKQYKTNMTSSLSQQGIGISYVDYLSAMNTNEEAVKQIFTEEYTGSLYYASMVADKYVTAKHILVQYDNDEHTKEEAEEIAKDIKAKLDAGEDFDKLMNEKSEDGRDEAGNLQSPDGYTFTNDGSMVPEFEKAAFAIKEGEISDIINVESEGYKGFHILKKLPTSLGSVAQSMTSTEEIEKEREAIVKDVKVETTDKINFYTEAYNN